ncbi:MAG: ABC transporter substrate-binding protein [bacterium]|nr:ABC transporter substrate-binding protein [bacterium]
MKKFLSMSLIVAMTVATLTGCGGGSTEEKGGADTLKIGSMGPITGGAAYYGTEVKQGAQIAIDEINEAGGINGIKVEFNFQDDEADAEKAVNAYNTLKDWGVQMIVGATTSDATISLAAETANDNVFQITPSGSSVDCVTNPNAFQVCFSDPNQGIASAQYIAENKLASKVAVIYDSSSSYSSGIYENFAKKAKAEGIDIVATGSFTADNNTDFSVQLQDAKNNGAELVFLPVYYQQACIILKQAADMQYAPTFFGCDGLDGILGVDGFDTALAEGVMLLTPFAADDMAQATQDFVAKYEEAYKATPSQFAADAYDAVYVVKAAAEKAGITADMSASDICDALVEQMKTIEVEGITSVEGVPMKWDENGMVDKAPKAVIITDGAYKAM